MKKYPWKSAGKILEIKEKNVFFYEFFLHFAEKGLNLYLLEQNINKNFNDQGD